MRIVIVRNETSWVWWDWWYVDLESGLAFPRFETADSGDR